MTTQYTCELCKKEFKQKGDLTKHKNKKTPCISIDEIKNISYLFILRILESFFNNKSIDIDKFIDDINETEDNKKKLKKFTRFSNLIEMVDDNIVHIME